MNAPKALHQDLTMYAAALLAVLMAKAAPQTIPFTITACVLAFVIIIATRSPTPRLVLVTIFLAIFTVTSLVCLALIQWA